MDTLQDLSHFFVWNVNPILFSFGPVTIRWYGLLFACGFFLGYQLLRWMYKCENKPLKDLDTIFMYMVVGTVVGARLGHCLFYDPAYYFSHLLDFFKVWEGGLASHGAVIGILVSLYIYSRKKIDQPFLWLVSRMTIAVALAAVFIRTGNFFNSEIVGTPSELPWAIVFPRLSQLYGVIAVPRHPAQLYEAFAYLIIFAVMLRLYIKWHMQVSAECLIGIFFTTVFSARFLIEFIKEDQSSFEAGMWLNMGQLLSIPMILCGIYMLWRCRKKGKECENSTIG